MDGSNRKCGKWYNVRVLWQHALGPQSHQGSLTFTQSDRPRRSVWDTVSRQRHIIARLLLPEPRDQRGVYKPPP